MIDLGRNTFDNTFDSPFDPSNPALARVGISPDFLHGLLAIGAIAGAIFILWALIEVLAVRRYLRRMNLNPKTLRRRS